MRKRHEGLPRAFDLAGWSYCLDFALVPAAIVILPYLTGDVPMPRAVIAAIAGILVWTLAEYWIHRLAFHGETPFQPMHDMHHRLPKDMIGAASWLSFSGFLGVWDVAWLLIGPAASWFTAGFMAGYLAYCAIHVRMHHGNVARFGRAMAFMYRHHVGHHRGGLGNFGVTSPLWDITFNTFKRT